MKEIIIVADYTENTALTVPEICEIFNIEANLLRDYASYDIISPRGGSPDEWVFTMTELKRLRTAIRLQRDLELNYAGIALVMQLLEEMEDLRELSEIYHKHILK